MKASCTFPGATFKNLVTGYRISFCYTRGQGFQGNFYVYVQVQDDANKKHGTADLLDKGNAKEGTLELTGGSDQGVEHTLPGIQLNAVDELITRSEKCRLIEFKYPTSVTDTNVDKFEPKFKSKWDKTVGDGKLGDQYKFNIGKGEENLLAFAARRVVDESNVLRFVSYANTKGNCWLSKLVAFAKKPADAFKISFASQSIDISAKTLVRAYVEESFGDMLAWPQRSLGEYNLDGDGGLARWIARARTTKELVSHQTTPFKSTASGDHVQTATFVLDTPHYRNLKID